MTASENFVLFCFAVSFGKNVVCAIPVRVMKDQY